MYARLRGALFRLEAERAHDLVLGGLGRLSGSHLARRFLDSSYAVHDPRLRVEAFGLTFPNPLSVAAGLDKRGVAVYPLGAIGFGGVEVGSVTALPQPGNPRPRLFRLAEDEALINRMGFNNEGAAAVARRLRRQRDFERSLALPGSGVVIGVNVGKSRVTPLEEAPDDYRASFEEAWDVADYLVINVSSPNTPGLRTLQGGEPLARIVDAVERVGPVRSAPGRAAKPVLLKLSPDLGREQLLEAVAVAEERGLAGLIATNTTTGRGGLRSSLAGEEGGLSGRPLAPRALEVLELLREATELPLVSVGGILTGADALERVRAGADLLQVYTGFVYRGPALVREVLQALLAEMERKGVSSVSALRG